MADTCDEPRSFARCVGIKCVSIKGMELRLFIVSTFSSYTNTARKTFIHARNSAAREEKLRVARLILTRRNFLAAFVAIRNLKFSSRTERVHLKHGKVGLWSREICTPSLNVIAALAAWSNYHPRKEQKRHCRNPNISLRERHCRILEYLQLDRLCSG